MGIDIVNLKFDEMLTTLGDDDWEISLPCDFPDLRVSAAWRQRLIDDAGEMFIRWVKHGVSIDIDHRGDPSWDRSGTANKSYVDPMMLLVRYATLGEWMEDAYTGNNTASYESGCGLYWDTYKSEINDLIIEKLMALFQTQLTPILGEDHDWMDTWEDLADVQLHLEIVLQQLIEPVETQEVWKRLEASINVKLDMEARRQAEEVAKLKAQYVLIRDFWHTHFPDIDKQSIDRPAFREMKLAERLANILLDTDPEVVEAIARLGLPGYFSNTVKQEILSIARQALDGEADYFELGGSGTDNAGFIPTDDDLL